MSYTNANPTDLLLIECAKPQPQIQIVKQLLLAGIDPHIVTDKGHSPLMLHIIHSSCPNSKLVILLVNAGVPIQKKNAKDIKTALNYCLSNDSCSIEVFKTLFQLGANPKDINDQFDQIKNKKGFFPKISEDILLYLERLLTTNNAENTTIRGIPLHKTLENYINRTNIPNPVEISKIIESYKLIPGIYPSSDDTSGVKTSLVEISDDLLETLNIFFIAAEKRCSIEIFQTLLFDYGIDMANRFGVDLMDVLGGNYKISKEDNKKVPKQNIISSYINSKYKSSLPFDLTTFRYLTTVCDLSYNTSQDIPHPITTISDWSFSYDKNLFFEIIQIFVESDINMSEGQNALKIYLSQDSVDVGIAKLFVDTFNLKKYFKLLDTVLIFLLNNHHIQIFNILIDHGIDLNVTDEKNNNLITKYLQKVEANSHDVLKSLISHIDPTTGTFKHNEQDLILYCRQIDDNHTDTDVLDFLLEHSPNVNYVENEFNCLMTYLVCTKNPKIEFITAMIEAGVNVNFKNTNYGNATCLDIAVIKQYSKDVISCLIKNKAHRSNFKDSNYEISSLSYVHCNYIVKPWTYNQYSRDYDDDYDTYDLYEYDDYSDHYEYDRYDLYEDDDYRDTSSNNDDTYFDYYESYRPTFF